LKDEIGVQINPVTELTHQLITFADYYQKHNGVINSSNLTAFCQAFKDTNQPKVEGYAYKVSELEILAAKLFKITPESVIPVIPIKPIPNTAVTPPAGGIYGTACGFCNEPLNGQPYVFSGIKRGNIVSSSKVMVNLA
jgi:hypothetical protein